MSDADDDRPSRTGLARGRRREPGRAAVRALLARLAWLDRPLVCWTGTPTPAAGPVVRAIQRRLGGQPPGLYAVHVTPAQAKPDPDARDAVRLARLAHVDVDDPLPVTAGLIARTTRRLTEADRFPRLLPAAVGDVAAWRATRDAAVQRARRQLDNHADPAAGLILGGPPVVTAKHPLGWPLDVLAEAERRVGPDRLTRLARSVPLAGDAAVVDAVRTRLLVAPDSLTTFLDAVPDLLALHGRLADEPARRLRAAATIQGGAVTAALASVPVTGPIPLRADDLAVDRRSMVEMRQRYQAHVTTAIRAYYTAVLPTSVGRLSNWFPATGRRARRRAVQRGRPVDRPVGLSVLGFLTDLFWATELRRAMLAAEVPTDRRRLLASAPAGPGGRRVAIGPDGQPLRYETLSATATAAVWADATAGPWPRHPLAASVVLDAAAVGTLPLAGPMAVPWRFAEACCHVWPPGNAGSGVAAGVLLAVAAVAREAGDAAAVLAALDALAPSILCHVLRGVDLMADDQRRYRRERLEAEVRTLAAALAAGFSVDDLRTFTAAEAMDTLRLAAAPVVPPYFAAFARRMRDYVAEWSTGGTRPAPSEWGLSGHWAGTWAEAYAELGPPVLDAIVRDVGRVVGPALAVTAMRRLTGLVEETDKGRRPAQRAIVAVAVPPLVRRLSTTAEGERRAVLEQWYGAITAADAAAVDGGGDGPAVFAECFASVDVGRLGGGFFAYLEDRDRCGVASLAGGRADRLLTLARLNGRPADAARVTSVDAAHAGAGWAFLRSLSPTVTAAVSTAAGRWPQTPRAVAAVARLGLCVRFHRRESLRASLADVAGDDGDLLAELVRWRGTAGLPGRVREAVERPDRLRRELAALADRPSPAAVRRADHLRQQLADPEAVADWVRRDLAKVLPAAVDEARLARLEAAAESAVRGHVRDVLGVDLPGGLTDAARRNWDNALGLYLTVDKNRARVRTLLRREAVGDRASVLAEPRNAAFLSAVAKAGVDVAAWRGPFARRVTDAAGSPLRFEVEPDPLHVLQMGNYFGTCLSRGDVNAFSTVANATDANKRVVYAYDGRGVVVGRKLLAMTTAGEIVGFATYGTGAPPATLEPDDDAAEAARERFKALLDAFCGDLARHCGATLHRHGNRDGQWVDEPPTDALALAAEWYNDGAEPFGDIESSNTRRAKAGTEPGGSAAGRAARQTRGGAAGL